MSIWRPPMPLTKEQFDAGIREMAETCFGFGRWNAPYWFIGPEQGIGDKSELALRLKTWLDMDKPDLCDCEKFHRLLGDRRWHRTMPEPQLQPTWQWLMLLLLTYLKGGSKAHETFNKNAEQDCLRKYQQSLWGSIDGQSCVIELCGLPAKDLTTGQELRDDYFSPDEYAALLRRRIKLIRRRIAEHKPKFVIMYGAGAGQHYGKIVEEGNSLTVDRIAILGCSAFLFTEHPVAPLRKDPGGKAVDKYARWMTRGRKLGEMINNPQ